jgi:hypothetical protein
MFEHLLPRPHGRPPQLREGDIELQQVVRVEDDALGIALAVADAKLMDEGLGHRGIR